MIDVQAFLKQIPEANRAYVTIGVHEDAGSYTKGDNPPTVVEVALWNEYGTTRTPERSFFRSTIDENASLLNQWREEVMGNILFKQWTVYHALETIGFRVQTLIQNKIKSHVPPPNAPSTIEDKQRRGVAPETLIDSGLMLRSVTFQVHMS